MNRFLKNGLIAVGGTLFGTLVGMFLISKKMSPKIKNAQELSEKHLTLYKMMNQWMKYKQEGKKIEDYFEKKGYRRIAIYGMSYAGETLLNELHNSKIEVAYGIDNRKDSIYVEVDVYSPNDSLEHVDAIVVTAITFFDEIEEMLLDKVNCPIVSLEDILYD